MQTRMAMITYMDGGDGARPDNSLPSGGGNYPSQGLPPGAVQLPVFPFDPTGEHPSQGLPGAPGHPSQGLPIAPGAGHPSQGLPGGPAYPSHQPIAPGGRFIVKYFACHGLILVPDNSLPSTPEPKK